MLLQRTYITQMYSLYILPTDEIYDLVLTWVGYHFSTYGLRSSSKANVVRGWVCRNQYESAIYLSSAHTPHRNLDRILAHRLRTKFRIRMRKFPLLRPRDIDHPVDNHMRDVDSLRTELAREALGQSAQGELACREGGEGR